jgi:hypothetical protein
MRPERVWFLSEGEKSEGRMGADFPRWGKLACDEPSNPHLPVYKLCITDLAMLPLNHEKDSVIPSSLDKD